MAKHAHRWAAGLLLLPLLLCASLLPACASDGGGAVYLHPNADLGRFRDVAVLPLENLSSDRYAADRVREVLVVELLASGAFDVTEQGEVNRVLRQLNVGLITELGPEQIAAIGGELGVEGLLLGSVMEFRERRTGTFTAPEISLSLRMVDVETGLVVWLVSDARTGLSLSTRLFGVGEATQTEVVRDLVRQLIDELFEAAGT
jgi:curli biogenesis system outer membrane secretion channel CsgG